MSDLRDFTDQERLRIVALPVRLAFYISHIDDVPGTSRDEARERLAIEKALESVRRSTDDAEFANDLAESMLASRVDWPAWENAREGAMADIPAALALVDGRLPAAAGRAYRRMVYYMAAMVAQAAGEANTPRDAGRTAIGGGFFARLADRLSVRTDLKMPENVSKNERAALQKLQRSLKG